MLILKNLTVKAGHKTILKNLNFHFEKGKTYAVMGPNGSGKSTLSMTLMGNPAYQTDAKSSIVFNNKTVIGLSADKRVKLGIFMTYQTPIPLSGVTVFQLMRLAIGRQKDPLALKEEIEKHAQSLKINAELLERSLNDGASGGEKKKLEVLQAAIMDPRLVIFDEIDTGVDVDSLKTIARFMNKNKKEKTYIIITHYNRILKYVKPDKVLILIGGELKKVGSAQLAADIEREGYEKIK